MSLLTTSPGLDDYIVDSWHRVFGVSHWHRPHDQLVVMLSHCYVHCRHLSFRRLRRNATSWIYRRQKKKCFQCWLTDHSSHSGLTHSLPRLCISWSRWFWFSTSNSSVSGFQELKFSMKSYCFLEQKSLWIWYYHIFSNSSDALN